MADATGIREYKGAAVQSALVAGINAASTSFSITPTTNWPTGAGGNFSIVIDQGTSAEESILCSAQATGVITVVTRGYDNTAAISHSAGAIVTHGPTAIDVSEANYIANVHAQTSKAVPVGADEVPLFDSAAIFGLKKSTLTNLWAALASLTQVLTNKDLTSPTNLINWPSVAGKNTLINGDQGIDQRNAGAAQTLVNGVAAYTVDRWLGYCLGSNVTGQRIAGSGSSKYRYQYTGAASNTSISHRQRIESANSAPLAGSTVTFGIDLSNSLSTTVIWVANYANTADNFGAITQFASGTFIVTAALTRYNAQIAIPVNGVNGIEIIVQVNNQVSGTWVIGNAQLELGSTPTTFSRTGGSIGEETVLCQRYYQRYSATGNNATILAGNFASLTQVIVTYFPPVTMRALPSLDSTQAAGNFRVINTSAGGTAACTSYGVSNMGVQAFILGFNFTSLPGNLGLGSFLQDNNAGSSYLAFSSEL